MNSLSITDLTKGPPRSPRIKMGGFVILSRAIDKCRATIAGKEGEYEYNCELDNFLFSFKGIDGIDFKKYVEAGHSDAEILEWVNTRGITRSAAEIADWSQKMVANDYSDNPENKEWLEGENVKLGLPKDGLLFDYLDADDKASFLTIK